MAEQVVDIDLSHILYVYLQDYRPAVLAQGIENIQLRLAKQTLELGRYGNGRILITQKEG